MNLRYQHPGLTSDASKVLINLTIGSIKRYDYNKLNEDQKMTYNIIVDLVDNINAKTMEMGYLSNNYLGSYLGYQAQLPLLLVEYKFRTKLDIENYFKYLDLVPETLKPMSILKLKRLIMAMECQIL
ncbi:MAG: hypothetical protein ACLU5J_05200 [Christensenellales bacterium]